jgi:hypothetical protein
VIGFAAIAAGSPSSTGALTDHLLNNTVTQEQARLAAYYARGMVRDEVYELAQQVADGTLSFSAAVDEAKSNYLRDGHDPDLADAAAQRVTNLLHDLAFRLSESLGDAPVGIVRPDLHPIAARALGIEEGRHLDRDAINALLVDRRLPWPGQDLRQVGRHFLELSRQPTLRSGSADHSGASRPVRHQQTSPVRRPTRLATPSDCPGFCPCYIF